MGSLCESEEDVVTHDSLSRSCCVLQEQNGRFSLLSFMRLQLVKQNALASRATSVEANVAALDVADHQHGKGDSEDDIRLANPSDNAGNRQRAIQVGGI
ncbi:hypothetical protein [Rubinisphaera italica]|uniref:Uncharacterized protein n=1 Tax=Rubinisphaera italica TaxID=2527969 RepID=A0A5C5XAA4_9PLAN|nr:hypothetical protein [Rubinisphaera italica]TWT59708.1 hypothetical protein Pan54_04180 [Rubinisphaera italica]